MARTDILPLGITGWTVYATLESAADGSVVLADGSANGTWADASLSTYAIACAEQGTASGQYKLTVPTGAGISVDTDYIVVYRRKMGGSVAITDPIVGAGLVSGSVDVKSIAQDSDAATNLKRATLATAIGTVGSASTTTSVVSSALTPAGAAADQFKGRIMIFDKNTTTAALRGQATDITASTNSATPTFTVSALTTAPVSGDTFTIT